MFDLTDKKALVTGVTGGIGAEIARTLVKAGAKVVGTGRRQEKLETLVKELGQENFFPLVVDLADLAQAKTVAATAQQWLGGIDILVNNAGITKDGLCMRMKETDFDEVIELNLKVPFLLSQACIMPMIRNKSGRIINISSVVGVTGNAGQANYCSAKAGLIGQSKALAQELASRNITVNVVAPGFIATEMTDGLAAAHKEKLLESIPAKKMGTSQDIAMGVLYFASDESAYVTGQTLHINGGMAMI